MALGVRDALRLDQFVHAELARILGFRAVPLRELLAAPPPTTWADAKPSVRDQPQSLPASSGNALPCARSSLHQTNRCSTRNGPATQWPGRPIPDQDRTWQCRFRDPAGSDPIRLRTPASAEPARTSREYRIATRVAADGKFLDQPLERSVIVRKRAQRNFPRVRQQLAERGIARQLQAQSQRILKTAEQRFQFRMLAARRSPCRSRNPPASCSAAATRQSMPESW